jgi:hypothetical protein
MMCRLTPLIVGVALGAAPLAAAGIQLETAAPQVSVDAQEKPAPQPQAPREQPREQPRGEQPVIPTGESRAPVLANVKLDLTITDQRGSATPVVKTVSLVLADRGSGRIRTQGDIRTPQGYRPITLNVDAFPEFMRDGRVRVALTIEYRPTVGEGTSEEQASTNITETVTVLLEDGKPLVVSQSADPYTDRKVKVELKATVLK